MTRYRTIVADPPWDYGTDAIRLQPGRGVTRRTIPYRNMAVDEMAALPVSGFAATEAALFLWTTSRFLPKSFGLLRAWGFEYRQTLVWRKTPPLSPLGGSVAPNHAEFLLVGRRGRIQLGRLASSVITAPSPGSHSAKPECFLDHIEAISPGPYVELFARRARFGWDYWGDESLGTANAWEDVPSGVLSELADEAGFDPADCC